MLLNTCFLHCLHHEVLTLLRLVPIAPGTCWSGSAAETQGGMPDLEPAAAVELVEVS